MGKIVGAAKKVRLLIFDVDGVLTDGGLILGDDGQEYKVFNSKDGHGMKMLQNSGVEIGVITARESQLVKIRMEGLGVRHLYQGQSEKLPAFLGLIARLGLTPEQVAYVGDDVLDLPIMLRVGLSVAVADAHPLVREKADWTTRLGGGKGAAREVCDFIMQVQGTLDAALQPYLALDDA